MTVRVRSAAVAFGLVVTIASAGVVACAEPGEEEDPSVRRTTLGAVRGLAEEGSLSWLAIPYAEPPVGELRWRAPVTHRPWEGVREARAPGNGCVQEGRMFSPAPSGPHFGLDVRDGLKQPVGSEDCLTLNVHRPSTPEADLPVIVFVHGGSNVVGYSADPMYDGRALAQRANAVVVTVNYRLGVMGWFDHPALKTGDPDGDSGNFGTLDQIEALRFVHDNAAAFGGDPGNVTVMGESAGAVNVWALLVSPRTAGLIHKIIPMSGGLKFESPVAAREYATAFAEEALGSPPGDDAAARLRALPAEEVIRAQVRRGAEVGDPPRVLSDGVVLPADHHAAIATGSYRDVPVLAGNTLEEGKLFGAAIGAHRPSERDRFTLQYEFDPDRPTGLTERDLMADRYLPVDGPGGWNEAAAGLTRSIFTGITHDSMNTMQAAGNDQLYYYQFGWNQQPAPFDAVYGAAHAIDLPFVFRTFDEGFFTFGFSRRNEPGRLELSDLMTAAIHAFVRTGDPHHPDLGAPWEQWPRSMVLDATDERATARPGAAE
ncbi:carboxylesterase/lipase family protein [Pseudonocardia zijingensis]|uniref:Carboxylic ester hydrolase n=1 Tax=Pseudonocardia zijingensis TaxID=153376 RepID=A0ABP4BA96_9PSEU